MSLRPIFNIQARLGTNASTVERYPITPMDSPVKLR